jgi:hypothetical protein
LREGVDGQKIRSIFFRSIFNPTHHYLYFCVGFIAVRIDLVGKCCGGKLGWSDLSIPCQKLCVRYYHPHKTCCACKQRSKNQKKRIIQTIMVSTRSSDYVAISGGGNGINGKSRLSRLLARGPLPRGKEEKDNESTLVAFDVDDGNGGKVVEVNGECKGNGNSNGPIDNNNDNNYDIGNDNNNDDDGGGAGQKRKRGTIVEEREEMEVEEEEGEEAVCMTFLSRKSKLGMNEVALFEYFNTRLEETTQCANKRCTCLAILGDASARASVAKYLTWFEQRNKYKQDSIVFEWFRYSSFLKTSMSSQVGIAVGLFVGLLYQLGTLRVISDNRVTQVCTSGYRKPWYGIVLLIHYVPWSTDRSISF